MSLCCCVSLACEGHATGCFESMVALKSILCSIFIEMNFISHAFSLFLSRLIKRS